jgi:hypothetical protein
MLIAYHCSATICKRCQPDYFRGRKEAHSPATFSDTVTKEIQVHIATNSFMLLVLEMDFDTLHI